MFGIVGHHKKSLLHGALFFLYLQGCLVNADLNEHDAKHQVEISKNDLNNISSYQSSSMKNGINEGVHQWNNGSYVKMTKAFT